MLAAAWLVSACGGGGGGGGAATDTTPPTVTITAAAGSGGTVVFSFAFSEPVGNSFAAEDVTVTGGGTAASVARLDDTHYTLSVRQARANQPVRNSKN